MSKILLTADSRLVSMGYVLVSALLCLSATACSLLPSDGPNRQNIAAAAGASLKTDAPIMRYVLVGITAPVAQSADEYYRPTEQAIPRDFPEGGSFGQVGIGDSLRVTVWEAGEVGLFSGRDKKSTDIVVRVDTDGTIALPYAGRFRVAGQRLSQVENAIVARLQGQAVQPQATVIISENISNSVSVQGDVTKPGPYPIAKAGLRVLDLIAMGGGAKYPAYEMSVRLTRGRSTMTVSLQELIERPEVFNVAVSAGDALLLLRIQQKFFAFGAVMRPGEQAFVKNQIHLSDGLGQVMGTDANRSDAKGVYLFRREPLELVRRYGFQPAPEDTGDIPIVYQLDLRDPGSFFVLNTFPVRANDILYVSPAPLAEASRFFQILSGATNTVAIPRTLIGNYPTGQ